MLKSKVLNYEAFILILIIHIWLYTFIHFHISIKMLSRMLEGTHKKGKNGLDMRLQLLCLSKNTFLCIS
jgi:hypothetical protein